MKKPQLSLKPQTIDDSLWYYESKGGIEIVHQARNKKGELIYGVIKTIPWRKLASTFKRYTAWKATKKRTEVKK